MLGPTHAFYGPFSFTALTGIVPYIKGRSQAGWRFWEKRVLRKVFGPRRAGSKRLEKIA
jgi:hypothetical protein